MPTKKKTAKPVKKPALSKKPTPKVLKKSAPAKKTVSRATASKVTSKKDLTYWESLETGHAETFAKHPNLKLLLFIFIVCFIIFLIVEIPIIYAQAHSANYLVR